MKLIVIGATGFVGGAVLRRALDEPTVTSIVALTRRELPKDVSTEEKIKTVIVEDFSVYSDDIVAELQGAEACIWSMGGRASQFPDSKAAHLANVDYLHAGAKAFAEKVAPGLGGRKFRFVYCSGAMAERNTDRGLLFLADSRKLKGEAENGLLEIENAHSQSFSVYIGRPGGILGSDSGIKNRLYGAMGIGKGHLAHAFVDIALQGASKQVFENNELRSMGTERSAKASSVTDVTS